MALPPHVITVSTRRSFPLQTVLTGTISTSGLQVTGTGTSFLTELVNPNTNFLLYKYIFNPATAEMREIDFVQSATLLRLKTAFTPEISGQAFNVVNAQDINSLTINPQGAGVIYYTVGSDGTTLDPDATVMVSDDAGLFPVSLDCTANSAQVTIQ